MWSPVKFNPEFKKNLYFLYLGKKQSTEESINYYEKKASTDKKSINDITSITREVLAGPSYNDFNRLIREHEKIVSTTLQLPMIKEQRFSDFWGDVKSLGAWGGDFALISSDRGIVETEKYFFDKQYEFLIPYSDIILEHKNDRSIISDEPIH